MTLEEKAKKLASSVPLRRDIPFQDYIRIQLASMYYTGAVENGIIWHDLRKNPKDLPKRLRAVWVKTEYDDYCEGYWWPERNRWQDSDMGDGESIGAVVAWCEIPKYTEE